MEFLGYMSLYCVSLLNALSSFTPFLHNESPIYSITASTRPPAILVESVHRTLSWRLEHLCGTRYWRRCCKNTTCIVRHIDHKVHGSERGKYGTGFDKRTLDTRLLRIFTWSRKPNDRFLLSINVTKHVEIWLPPLSKSSEIRLRCARAPAPGVPVLQWEVITHTSTKYKSSIQRKITYVL